MRLQQPGRAKWKGSLSPVQGRGALAWSGSGPEGAPRPGQGGALALGQACGRLGVSWHWPFSTPLLSFPWLDTPSCAGAVWVSWQQVEEGTAGCPSACLVAP